MKKTVHIKNITIGEGLPKICVPVIGSTREEILMQTEAAAAHSPDLLEWRVDFFEECMDEEAVSSVMQDMREKMGEIPLLFTFRTAREGGNRSISAKDYADLLSSAAKHSLDLIDVEIYMDGVRDSGLIEQLQTQKIRVIASNHHFEGTPSAEEMLSVLGDMEQAGADILKLAVMPQNTRDLLKLLSVTEEGSRRFSHPLITMAMGGCGVLSRIAGEQFGSAVTFACVGRASAPGQIPIAKLREMMSKLHEFGEKM